MIDSATQARNAVHYKVLHASILTFSMMSFALNAANARLNNDLRLKGQPANVCSVCLDPQQTAPTIKVRHPRRLRTSRMERVPGAVFASQAERSALDSDAVDRFTTPSRRSISLLDRRPPVAGDGSAGLTQKRRPPDFFILGQRRHDSWCNGCGKTRMDSAEIITT